MKFEGMVVKELPWAKSEGKQVYNKLPQWLTGAWVEVGRI